MPYNRNHFQVLGYRQSNFPVISRNKYYQLPIYNLTNQSLYDGIISPIKALPKLIADGIRNNNFLLVEKYLPFLNNQQLYEATIIAINYSPEIYNYLIKIAQSRRLISNHHI